MNDHERSAGNEEDHVKNIRAIEYHDNTTHEIRYPGSINTAREDDGQQLRESPRREKVERSPNHDCHEDSIRDAECHVATNHERSENGGTGNSTQKGDTRDEVQNQV